MSFDRELEERLVRYCAVDTQSDADSPTAPSTNVQYDLLRMLEAELKEMGAQDVTLTEYGVVLATVPGTAPGPTIGLLAHVDTAPQFNATGVKPRVIRGYNGGDITYPDNPDLVLSPENSPYLGSKQGHDIITASGLTLLGADDKAGVAIIMTLARHLLENPDILQVTTTVGRGAERFVLTYASERSYASYGQFIIEVELQLREVRSKDYESVADGDLAFAARRLAEVA